MKFSIKDYWKPTPTMVRKIADSFLMASTFISTSAIVIDFKILAVTSVLLGATAKFFSNFFSEDEK